MFKFLRVLLLVVGILLLVATVGLLVWNVVKINDLAAEAIGPRQTNPAWVVVLASATAALGAFMAGLALPLPEQLSARSQTVKPDKKAKLGSKTAAKVDPVTPVALIPTPAPTELPEPEADDSPWARDEPGPVQPI